MHVWTFSMCVHELDSFDGGRVMLWVAISIDRKTEALHVSDNFTDPG